MKIRLKTLFILGMGILIGVTLSLFFVHNNTTSNARKSSDDPLYWVAPMDANYKRDKPGKSPMGMDLVPVYADDLKAENDPDGTVTISPAVENNLGVKITQVKQEPLSPNITTFGQITFDESLLWQINVRTAGWVEKLTVDTVGEAVNKGDILFLFYSPELVKAQEELLHAKRTGRKAILIGAEDRLLALGVDPSQIKEILTQGKAIDRIAIKAPANGIISELNVREGGYLPPAQIALVAGSLETIWVDAEIFERQSYWVKLGMPVSMTLNAFPNQTWTGKIDYIYPLLDPKTRSLRLRVGFDNPDHRLKPNMFARLVLAPENEKSVLTVPASAVIRAGNMARVVLAEGNGKFRSNRVNVGRETKGKVEITDGLKEGDAVVVSAQFMLDSESSQTADFSRMAHETPAKNSVWVKGDIVTLMPHHKMLTINHAPVPEWDWPGMEMSFTLAEDLAWEDYKQGQQIDFEIQKTDQGMYEIIDYQLSDATRPNQVTLKGEINLLLAEFGMLTLSHEALAAWQWAAGEMNFNVKEGVDLSAYQTGQMIEVTIEKQGSDYLITAIQPVGDAQ